MFQYKNRGTFRPLVLARQRQARAKLAEDRRREKEVREAQAQYQEQQRIFRERAARGSYRKALKEELAKHREIYDAGGQLAGKLEVARS